MDPEARRRACVDFRVKLRRDTGVNLTAADCARLLDNTYESDGREGFLGLARDAARGFELSRQAVAEGYSPARYQVGMCYLAGVGVEKDAAHGVSLLRQVLTQESAWTANAQFALALCYRDGEGVEVDTVQAALWCQRAAEGGVAEAIENLAIIRTCNFCGTTPARKHCERCRKVRYCDTMCQAAHWNRATDPHKELCRRRAAEASEERTAPPGGAASSPSAP